MICHKGKYVNGNFYSPSINSDIYVDGKLSVVNVLVHLTHSMQQQKSCVSCGFSR